ncbi:hypothetical protein ACS4N0_13170 [Levilactobacillus zymae]|uniref:hypothetical protein n=1 Tax=Levilactobacillus zymae TaxID=267363 RepID=UPI003FCD92A9
MAKIMKIMVMLLVPLGFITTVGVTAQAKAQSTPYEAPGISIEVKINSLWQITSLIRTSPESFNGSLLMMYF